MGWNTSTIETMTHRSNGPADSESTSPQGVGSYPVKGGDPSLPLVGFAPCGDEQYERDAMPVQERSVLRELLEGHGELAIGFSWEYAERTLNELSLFEADWDGDGADTPHPKAIRNMRSLLEKARGNGCKSPTIIYAAADGSVFAEWFFIESTVVANACTKDEVRLTTLRNGSKPSTVVIPCLNADERCNYVG